MAITKNKMVSLTYDLRIEGANGELIEQATAEKPLNFVYGAGLMMPKFEALLEGLEQGNDFNINLSCDEAYGQIDENAIVDLPKHLFLVEGKFDDEIIKVGNTVPMMSASGQRMNGLVLEITDEIVKMDFNHPLAGEDLFFKGKVLEVREATDEEIAATVQGGCGCGSGGSCNDGGCGCEDESCATEGASAGGCGCGC
ncbi:FKBP-type peptidyl-prolyl cis-trans isomerase [uncultured Sunxiuqinia sp.]|jgi:FKBP-type peptidyl-prolyl cis-trans isomerase SlyD|uniref:FKBP-type peptidyl-prolyl cis-trans isomerase n=1 Tax=uncultured Sunxiuqinia sp. TaxID=1573825 RepID=UPI0030DD7AB0|tara:strand:- start:28983 stop:29576 length:594 start_codon:yes stop_codon:yes gene_type:complete